MNQENILQSLQEDWRQIDEQSPLIPIEVKHESTLKNKEQVIEWRNTLLENTEIEGWLMLTDYLYVLPVQTHPDPSSISTLPLSAEYYCNASNTSNTSYRLIHQGDNLWQLHCFHYKQMSAPQKADYLAESIQHKVHNDFITNRVSTYYRCWGVDQTTQAITPTLAFFTGFEVIGEVK